MKNRNIVFLWSIFCFSFTTQQLTASSNCVVQSFAVTMQSFSESADLGLLTNHADQIKLDMQRQIAQILLSTRVDRRLYASRRSFFDENEDVSNDEPQGSDYKGHLQKLCMMMLLMLVSLPSGMLFGSDDRLSRNAMTSLDDAQRFYQRNRLLAAIRNRNLEQQMVENQHEEVPLVESIEELSSCCATMPHSIQALPVTYGTNIAGNILAIVIACFSPNVATAGTAAGVVGCVGGCAEGYSTDHDYISRNQHAWHNNCFTGYVADQVTGACGTSCLLPLSTAAAIGAPVGYACGLCSSLAVRSYLEGKPFKIRSHRVMQFPTQERMER